MMFLSPARCAVSRRVLLDSMCCDDAAEAYSRASWFDAAYVGSGSCSCIIPKGSDLGIAGGASSAIDICAADVLV